MSCCGEFALNFSLVDFAVDECESACFVVGCDDDECLSVVCGPLHDGSHGAVEVVCFFHEHFQVVLVSVVIELGSFDHEEESLRVLVQYVECFGGDSGEHVASFRGQRGIDGVWHGEYFACFDGVQLLQCGGCGVSFGL